MAICTSDMQGDLPGFRHRRGVRRQLQSTLDDTNPAKEDPEFVAAIRTTCVARFRMGDLRHASDYFDVFYLAADN